MSAPALKNRPLPVITVKTVCGWALSSRRAAVTSSPMPSPKAFRAFGLFSWEG